MLYAIAFNRGSDIGTGKHNNGNYNVKTDEFQQKELVNQDYIKTHIK